MKKVKIGDICDILNGYAFKSDNYVESGVRVIRIANVQKGYIEDNTPVFYPVNFQGIDKYMLEEGDLLISLTGNVGRVALLQHEFLPAALNQRVACLRLKTDDVIKGYLFHILNSDGFEQMCIQSSNGVAQKNMSTEWLKEYEIPLVPKNEQALIVSTLDKVRSIISNRKKELLMLDELIKARFVELFGDPVLNTKQWEVVIVDEVCKCMVPGRDKPKSFSGGIPWITIDDLIVNGITHNSKKGLGLTIKEMEEVNRKAIPVGSVIMSCVGNLGICSLAGCDMVINQQLHSFQCSEVINNVFLMFYLGQRTDYMESVASNTTILYMNKSACNSIPVILPPINLQNEFADFVQQIDKSKLSVQKSLDKLEILKKALMQKYFG